MMKIDRTLTPGKLDYALKRFWSISADKIDRVETSSRPGSASPVFTRQGIYTAQDWTEWTRGFQVGSSLVQFDATGRRSYLELGRRRTFDEMTSHLAHFGVHDHGFNIVSTFGTLWRMAREGKLSPEEARLEQCETALRISGAVQARRWTPLGEGCGFIHSFNGPHSLFVDTVRSLRSLALAHRLGQSLFVESDRRVSLLVRLLQHLRTTVDHNVYLGTGRDRWDVRGRVAHECTFNTVDGSFRSPATQQGYSPFSTWTRGLAWMMLGLAEQLEYLDTVPADDIDRVVDHDELGAHLVEAARAVCDYYIESSPVDGIPYWDTGAPGLAKLKSWADREADPYNDHEPVDSSAAAIACQGLIRLGRYLGRCDEQTDYEAAGLTVLARLLEEPYLCTDETHQGLILHSVYHVPRGWDHVPRGRHVPCGESSMWGDYHAREAALLVGRLAHDEPYPTFFGPVEKKERRR